MAHAGSEGTVYVGANEIAQIRGWSVTEASQTVDSTDIGDAYDTHIKTRKSWRARVNCFWDETDTSGQGALTNGASIILNLYPEGLGDTNDEYFFGTATVVGVTRNAAVDGTVEASFEAMGNGALTNMVAFASASGILPVLVLDYAGAAGGRFRADGVVKTFDDLHTFTRSSTALARNSSGIYATIGSGTRRLDHGVNGARIGLWSEGQRQNICLWSNDWANAAYDTVTNITAAKDQTGADGVSNSASSLLATAGNAVIRQSITSGSAARVFSAHVKRLVGTGVIEMTQDGGSTYTAITSLINASTYTQVGVAKATVTNPNVGFRIVTDTDKIAVQYSQSEIGPVKSSPIPTTTVAVTRAVETCKVATSAFGYVAATGTHYVEYNMPAEVVSDGTEHAILIHYTDVNNRIQIFKTGSGREQYFYHEGSTTLAQIIEDPAPSGDVKAAGAYKVNDFAFYINGAQIGTDTTGTPGLTPGDLNIGQNPQTSDNLDGHIKTVVYYSSRLSNADLLAVTS